MKRTALFPGSFDPFTKGHDSLVRRSIDLFDEIVIAIGVNSNKKYLFSLDQRLAFIKELFHNEPKVKVTSYKGLTVDFCKSSDIRFIIRGLRNNMDFVFEQEISGMNRALNSEIETVFLAALPELSAINSTIVREILKNGGDVSHFIPKGATLPLPSA